MTKNNIYLQNKAVLMKITISGKIGAGKTTVSKELCKRFKLKYLSTGKIMRDLAKEKGLSIGEFLDLAKKHPKYHRELDTKTKEIGKIQDDFVFDSRLAFYFIPYSIKLFLDVDIDIAARRIFKQKRKNEKENNSLEQIRKSIKKREKTEVESFKKLYGINHLDKKHYDLVIDTSKSTPAKDMRKIIDFLSQKQKL
ncbi:AAA family ATPase [Candidatus Woesearchaeota archaeon]|nr:AAA family ATPase [Candidatus Woesearchaeota archaeon]